MKILVVDNYDSFTFNLVNILRKIKHLSFDVIKSGEVDMDAVDRYAKILFSPGPDVPRHGDTMWQIIHRYQRTKGILGICLGFQAVGSYYGARLVNLHTVYHGKKVTVAPANGGDTLFAGIDAPFSAGLYHSWGLSNDVFPDELRITALSDDGRIMAIAHRKFDVRGVQFHPESVMTPEGGRMLENWLNI
jgi:anthranilate synthase component II